MRSPVTLFLAALFLIAAGQFTIVGFAVADYATPGLGLTYDFDDLVALSGGAVTGAVGVYEVHESLIISVGDRLEVISDTHVTFQGSGGSVGIEVNGSLQALGSPGHGIVFTGAAETPGCWRGFDYIDQGPGSQFHIAHAEIAYADIAVDVFGGDIVLEVCDIHDCLDKAVDFSEAGGLVYDCHIHHNRQRTVTMTLNSSPTFQLCVLDNNNLDNASPYPYFNVGLQGTNSPTILECTITGDGNHMSGGMAFWASCEAQVTGNHISGCGYGILCYSTGADPRIEGNTIVDNNIHPDTLNWGFGVACNGNNAPVLTGNEIRGHWYGVAAINGGRPNLGDIDNTDPADDGNNIILENGIGGQTYGFYNNTPYDQTAQNNFWGPQDPEDCIYHQPDDPSLGFVTWDPPIAYDAVPETPGAGVLTGLQAYPNPFNPRLQLRLEMSRSTEAEVVVLDVAGRRVRRLHSGLLPRGETVLHWDGKDQQGQPLASGVYWLRAAAGTEVRTARAVLVR